MISKRIAVIDIGKTNAKFAIVDTKDFDEIAVFTMPNKVRQGPYYPFFDVAAIWTFLLDKLKYTQAKFGIDAVSVTTHGASMPNLACVYFNLSSRNVQMAATSKNG
jgi:sugar (pentulose or hexulose) kinase